MPSCQVSSGTVDYDRGEGPSACKPKVAGPSLADFLNDQLAPLVKYLDNKMPKYRVAFPSMDSYVELVRTGTKAKVAVNTGATERMNILTVECAAVKVTLQEREDQLRVKEMECEDLRRELNAERSLRAEKEKDCEDLRDEVRAIQEVKRKLRAGLEESRGKFEVEFQRAEKLTECLATQERLAAAKIAIWEERLSSCDAAKSSELEHMRELEAGCRSLQSQLSAVESYLAIEQARL